MLIFAKRLAQGNSLIACLICSTLVIRRGILRLNFSNVIWRWQFACSEEWSPDSISKFDWVVKIRSTHDEKLQIKCVDSLIICCNPYWKVKPSLLEPSSVVILLLYQRLNFALKSPRMTARKGLFTVTESKLYSRLLINNSKPSWLWLGERYNEIKLHSLSLIFISKLIHSWSNDYFWFLVEEKFCSKCKHLLV